jgi:hypothetical protein
LRDPLLLRRETRSFVAQRQVVGDRVGDRAAAGPGEELLLAQVVQVAADRRRGHVQLLGELVDVDRALFGQRLEQRVQPFITLHPGLLLHTIGQPGGCRLAPFDHVRAVSTITTTETT